MLRSTVLRSTVLRSTILIAALALLAACASSPPVPVPPRWTADGTPILPTSPEGWARYQRERRLADGQEHYPMDALHRARLHSDAMPHYSTALSRRIDTATKAQAPQWEWLGPDNVAGRMRTLVFDPRDPDRMIAGGVSGGLWLTENAGNSWSALSDQAANINIGALAIDPVQPDTLYAGTGELYRNTERPYSAMWGQGILRSRDGGASFQQLLSTANDDFRYVSDLVISVHDHRRLYAATNSGIWRSADAGGSWTRVLRPASNADLDRYEGCNELLLLPDDSRDVLLASCASRSTDDRYWLPGNVVPTTCGGPCPAAVFRNADAAGSGDWQPVLSEAGMGRTQMDYARSSPNVLYAVSASIVPGFDRTGDGRGDYDNGLHAVFRSDDAGLTWNATLRNSSSDALSTYLLSYAHGFEGPECDFGERYTYGAGWYNMAIAVDPLDPQRVWVAGMEHYRSDDGGRSFGKASYWWYFGQSPYGAHADQHVLAFHPGYDGSANRRLYSGNDGGLTVTDNARAPTTRGNRAACAPTPGTVTWRALVKGMGTLQFYTGAVAADGSLYLGGAQDNGTVLAYSGSGNKAWSDIFGGDGAFVAVDPRTAQRLYVSSQNLALHRSDDGGTNFVPATSGIVDTPIFVMPYALDRSQPDTLWGGGNRLWRTSNRGAQWSAASTTVHGFDGRVSAIAIAPTDSNRVLAGSRRGIRTNHAALSASGTTQWTQVTPRSGWVSSLVFQHDDADVAYATYSTFGGDHVWKSLDGGISWAPIDGSGPGRLPDLPVHTLAIDPGDPQRLYVGTDMGVFVTTDGGARWAVENSGFANVIVESLQVGRGHMGEEQYLYAFTYGRGAWRVALSGLDGVAPERIDERFSGSFYSPGQSGHGWFLESIIADGTHHLVAAWYTYLDGEQRWLIGAAQVEGDRALVPLSLYHGGAFPPAFDPAAVQHTEWGTLELQFDDLDNGTASWSTDVPGFSDGSLPITRLTTPARDDAPVQGIAACHGGSWFDPQQSGHGLMLEVIDTPEGRLLVAVWYAFLDGAQAWLLGTGPIEGDSAVLAMQITAGGDFPPDFDPAAVQQRDWGTLQFTALGPDTARIDWSAIEPGFGDGSMQLQRLTSMRGVACATD